MRLVIVIRPRRLPARVRVCPFVSTHFSGSMRGVFEGVILGVKCAVLDGLNLCADCDHGVAESVDLGFRFALGRFDHKGSDDGPRHGWGVEPEVHQALGDVCCSDAASRFENSAVKDAFVRDSVFSPCVQHREVFTEACRHVVRI